VTESAMNSYDKPAVVDYGDLVELTAANFGCGSDDGSAKTAGNFRNDSIPFGQGDCRMP
jgi:hypothetical protein